MNTVRKLLLLGAVSLIGSELCMAVPLKGRVIDSDFNPLPGAVVKLDNSNTGAVTDIDGYYTLADVPEGKHKVSVSYLGFEPAQIELLVKSDTEATPDIMLHDAAKALSEVVVTGVFSGQARAINTQKGNLNLTNVVSSNQIGKFPDSNIGDALKRISGINMQYDQGETRFGQVRGTPAEFSSVTINGSRIPSAEGQCS